MEDVRAYANGWYDECITPQDFLTKAKEVERMGFTAAKFDPFRPEFLETLLDQKIRYAVI